MIANFNPLLHVSEKEGSKLYLIEHLQCVKKLFQRILNSGARTRFLGRTFSSQGFLKKRRRRKNKFKNKKKNLRVKTLFTNFSKKNSDAQMGLNPLTNLISHKKFSILVLNITYSLSLHNFQFHF